jgi:hypothetical protein
VLHESSHSRQHGVSPTRLRGGFRGRIPPPPGCWPTGSPEVSWCRWGTDARLSRWSAPRTIDLGAPSSSGVRPKEAYGVTERQAHGSQPVQVRSGETPGSPVAALPASGESPASKRRKTTPARGWATGRSATSREACSVVIRPPHQRDQEVAEPVKVGRRPWTAPGSLERVPRNPPAHGVWNGQRGVVGTGEALRGPGHCGCREAGLPITGRTGSGRRPRGRRRGS